MYRETAAEHDDRAKAHSIHKVHKAGETCSAMSALPAAFCQLSGGKRKASSNVEAASHGGSQARNWLDQERQRQFFGNFDAERRYLASSACEGAGADIVSAERAWVGLRGSGVHSTAGPTSSVRDGASAAAINSRKGRLAILASIGSP